MARSLQRSPTVGARTDSALSMPSPANRAQLPAGQQAANVQFGGQSIREKLMEKRRQAEPDSAERPDVPEEFKTVLANHIESAWERNKRAKLEIEQEGLKSMRQRDRQYEADVFEAILDIGGSEHYDGLTTTKCRAAESWIMDVFAPSTGSPYTVSHTPVPELSPDTEKQFLKKATDAAVQEAAVANQEMGMNLTGEQLIPIIDLVKDRTMEVYKEALEEEAKERADKMADKIDDQFTEGGWDSEFRDLVREFVTLPAAFMMGPTFRRRKVLKYKSQDGKWVPQVGQKIVMDFENVSFFDVYPEDDSTGVDDGDLFVRRRVSAKELASWKGVPGYDDEAINAVLDEYGRGGYRRWTSIDSARSHAELRSNHEYESSKIDVLRFFGSVQGSWIINHTNERGTGLDTKKIDPYEYYEIDAIKIGQYLIRVVINPDTLGRRPISKASFENVPGAFWGKAIPGLIRHEQNACNATARAIVNNTAFSSGPIWERNVDRTVGDDGKLYPFKEIKATSDEMNAAAPAVRFYKVPNETERMIRTHEHWTQRADENSGVPAYAHGSEDVGGAGNTASGLSMLMSSSSKLLRMAIYNLDLGVVEPVVEMTYNYNMLFSRDETVKGDLRVEPKGATVLLIREMMAARQGEFADSTNNPIDYGLMTAEGRLNLRKNQARNLDLDVDSIYPKSAEELGAMDSQQQQQPTQGAGGGGSGVPPAIGQNVPGPGTMDRGKTDTLDVAGRPLKDNQNMMPTRP